MIFVFRKKQAILILSIILMTLFAYGAILSTSISLRTSSGSTDKTIVIDAGHGGEDPGSVSDYSSVKEKDINLNIAIKLKELLEQSGYAIIMTRTEDKLDYQTESSRIIRKRQEDLSRRKQIMDGKNVDAVVSIHLNKFPQTKYSGAQTFYSPKCKDSKKLADCIQHSLREILQPENNRVALAKKEPLVILKNVKNPTVIVECGFLSNVEEEKKLIDTQYQDKIALTIKDGIIKYFQQLNPT